MDMDGRLVDAVPPPSRQQKSVIDWDAKAELAQLNPDKAVLAAENVSISQITAVRGYTRHPFRQPEGRIRIMMRNSTRDENGVRHGDIYFQWEPYPTDTTTKGTD